MFLRDPPTSFSSTHTHTLDRLLSEPIQYVFRLSPWQLTARGGDSLGCFQTLQMTLTLLEQYVIVRLDPVRARRYKSWDNERTRDVKVLGHCPTTILHTFPDCKFFFFLFFLEIANHNTCIHQTVVIPGPLPSTYFHININPTSINFWERSGVHVTVTRRAAFKSMIVMEKRKGLLLHVKAKIKLHRNSRSL